MKLPVSPSSAFSPSPEDGGRTKSARLKKFLRMLAYLGLCAAFGLVLGVLIYSVRLYQYQQQNENTPLIADNGYAGNPSQEKLSAFQTSEDLRSCAAGVRSSVVTLVVQIAAQQQYGTGLGSGVLYREDSDYFYAVTNAHVVADAKEEYLCTSEKTLVPITTVGSDAASDLAVVRIPKAELSEEVLSGLSLATLGDSSSLSSGDVVLAVGSPEDLAYQNSVTSGVVSCPSRMVDFNGQTEAFIQTDAPINPGNSGGGLFTLDGELVGIASNKLVLTELEGMGFAIPINRVKTILEKIAPEE